MPFWFGVASKAGSFDACVLTAAQAKEPELEEILVAVAEGLRLQELDLGVDPFQRPRADWVVVPGQKLLAMRAQGLGELQYLPDTRRLHHVDRAVQHQFARVSVGLWPTANARDLFSPHHSSSSASF